MEETGGKKMQEAETNVGSCTTGGRNMRQKKRTGGRKEVQGAKRRGCRMEEGVK